MLEIVKRTENSNQVISAKASNFKRFRENKNTCIFYPAFLSSFFLSSILEAQSKVCTLKSSIFCT